MVGGRQGGRKGEERKPRKGGRVERGREGSEGRRTKRSNRTQTTSHVPARLAKSAILRSIEEVDNMLLVPQGLPHFI